MAHDLADRVRENLKNHAPMWPGDGHQALEFVCDRLSKYDSDRGKAAGAALDIERIYDAVAALATRHDSELAAFAEGWHPSVEERDRMSDGGTSVYAALQHELVRRVFRVIVDSLGDVSYLHPLVRAGLSDGGITIATLNYDLTVETAGDEMGVNVAADIEKWSRIGAWDWPSAGVRLLKIHGSVNWIEARRTEFGPGQLESMTVRPPIEYDRESAFAARALIFGHGSKLRPDGPMLSLLAAFEDALSRADRLVVIGYSFRDPHMNGAILRWFTEDTSRVVEIVDPHFPMKASGGSPPTFLDLLLIAFDPDFFAHPGSEVVIPDRLKIHRERASSAIPRLFACHPTMT
jgi:hypothetical protein